MESRLPCILPTVDAIALVPNAGAHAQAAHGHSGEGVSLAKHGDAAPGAAAPRLVTRGESSDTPQPLTGGETSRVTAFGTGKARFELVPLPKDGVPSFAALTDWLNITFPFEGSTQAIANISRRIAENLTPKFGSMTDRSRGLHGFRHSFQFDNGGVLFAHGGQKGCAMLSIPGEGCALISDWQTAYRFLNDELKARITRWDGAVDDFKGEYSVDIAMAWYLDGRFGTHGNQPKMDQRGNWERPDGSGRTIYIGNGKNGKLLRVYEKGKQLGDRNSPWVRWELQFGNKDRFIPLEVLLNPGPYVAGGYTCLDWINEEASRIRTIRKQGEISYDCLTHYLRVAYGRHLNVMREIEGSADAVLDKLIVPGMPKRLQLPDIDIPPGDV